MLRTKTTLVYFVRLGILPNHFAPHGPWWIIDEKIEKLKHMKILFTIKQNFTKLVSDLYIEAETDGIGVDVEALEAFGPASTKVKLEEHGHGEEVEGMEWITAWSGFRYFFFPGEGEGEVLVEYRGARHGFLKQNLLPSCLRELNEEEVDICLVEGTYGCLNKERIAWPLRSYDLQKKFALGYALGKGLIDPALNDDCTWLGASPLEKAVEELARDWETIPQWYDVIWPKRQ